ncbi:hypothetical protein CVV38_03040 [Candidatus Peregrinibacteria bacterium HGW-Peregrinibacteria-1]|jgi:MFS family permease|nr:MAG: hypothetical protein CVV38_03040 [Candidatus Peregrinibacteria bacterium HGW-Peregrinibacteria-1]
MLAGLRDIKLINRIFNIQEGEWLRVANCWGVVFFYRFAFVLGWTLVLGNFVDRFGIMALPYLFMLNAFFVICGSVFYYLLSKNWSDRFLLFFWIGVNTLLMLFAFAFIENLFWLLIICAFAVGVVLRQFKIIFDSFVERIFNPLEAQRVFPLIESADTVGMLAAGLLIVLASGLGFGVWIIFLAIAVVLSTPLIYHLLRYEHQGKAVVARRVKVVPKRSIKTVFHSYWSGYWASTFFKSFAVMFMVQWISYSLLEFQYTKAVFVNTEASVVDTGSGFQHAFFHDLGSLTMLFSVSAIMMQVILGSRFLRYLGTFGAFLVHGVVFLFSVVLLAFNFTFGVAVLVMNNYVLTNVLNKNAYHTAFYAFKDKYLRETLEGVVQPIGALVGTCILILAQRIFIDSEVEVAVVNALLVAFATVLVVLLYNQQFDYTNLAIKEMKSSKSLEDKLHAAEILIQRGHASGDDVVIDELMNSDDADFRIQLLNAILISDSKRFIPQIFELISAPGKLGSVALDVVSKFSNLGGYFKKNTAGIASSALTLKKYYKRHSDILERKKVLTVVRNMNSIVMLDWLMDLSGDTKDPLRPYVLKILAEFKDVSFVNLFEKSYKSKDRMVRAAAIFGLVNLKGDVLLGVSFVEESIAGSKSDKIAALGLIGDLKMREYMGVCKELLGDDDVEVGLAAAIALLKMECEEGLIWLVERLIKHKNLKELHLQMYELDGYYLRLIHASVKLGGI